MSEDLHNIDKLFKQAIDQHEEEPSPQVWDAIDKNLDKKNVVSILKRYNKLKWVAAALLLFSFGMAMYTLEMRRKDKETVKKNATEKPFINNKESGKTKGEENNNNISPEKTDTTTNNTTVKDEDKALKNFKDNKNVTDNIQKEKSLQAAPVTNNNEKKKSTSSVRSTVDKTSQGEPGINKKPSIISDKSEENLAGKNNNVKEPATKNNDKTLVTNQNNSAEDLFNKQKESLAGKENNLKESTVKNNNKISIANGQNKSSENISANKPKDNIAENVPSKEKKSEPSATQPAKPETETTDKINTAHQSKKSRDKNSKIKADRKSPFTGTLFFSPDFISMNVTSDRPRFREDDRDEIKKNEKIKTSSSYGILIDYALNKKITVGTGASVSTRISEINNKTVYARPDDRGNVNYRISCSTGPAYIPSKPGNTPAQGDSTKALSGKTTLQYINIPVVIKYNFTKGKISLTPGVGISANFLSKGKVETTLSTASGNEATTTDIEGLRSNYFSGSVSIGAEYMLGKKVGLNFTPTARFALSPINKNAPVKTKINSFGLAAGISIRF